MNKLISLKNRILIKLEPKYNPNSITHKQALRFFNCRKKGYEEIISAVLPYISSEGVIFDIGANIGYFSLLLLENIDFRGSVYLFEPVPNLTSLCVNTFRDKIYKTKVFPFGLSDENKKIEIYTDNNGNIGWNTLISKKTTSNMSKMQVKVKSFDSLSLNIKPDLIKVDVEGAEYKVFRGMLNSLKTWKPLPVILCEVAWGQSHPDWNEELSVFKELENLGYCLCDLDKCKIDINKLQQTTDVLFLPR